MKKDDNSALGVLDFLTEGVILIRNARFYEPGKIAFKSLFRGKIS